MRKNLILATAILGLTVAGGAFAADVMVCKQHMPLRELNRGTTLLCDDVGKKKLHDLYASGWKADAVITEKGKNDLVVMIMTKP